MVVLLSAWKSTVDRLAVADSENVNHKPVSVNSPKDAIVPDTPSPSVLDALKLAAVTNLRGIVATFEVFFYPRRDDISLSLVYGPKLL